MKRLILLIEVDDGEPMEVFYDVLQEMIEDRKLAGYFTLTEDGKAVELPDHMAYERKHLIPAIVKEETSDVGKNNYRLGKS